TAHRVAGGRQYQPEHRRPADGRLTDGRLGMLRVDTGGSAGAGPVRDPAGRAVTSHRAAEGDYLSIVIPTIGRPSLRVLLDRLLASARHTGQPLPPVCLVDDRPTADPADGLPASLVELP